MLCIQLCYIRPGKVYRQSPFKTACGREVIFHYSLPKNSSKGIQKFMRVRKSVKNWSKIAIMKLEAVVFGVMRAVMINCKSTLPGLINKFYKT